MFRDVVLPSGAAAAVCLSVLCPACLSAEDEASIPCNSFEYWSGQKSINTVSQATMKATHPGLFRLKNDSYYFFLPFSVAKTPVSLCVGFVMSTSDWHRKTLFLSLPDCVTACA